MDSTGGQETGRDLENTEFGETLDGAKIKKLCVIFTEKYSLCYFVAGIYAISREME